MKKYLWGQRALLLTAVALLGGCDYTAFASEGWVGQQISKYIFITVGLMLLVVIPTLILIVWVALKYRKGQDAEYEPEWEHSNKIEMWAWGIPIFIIVILASITYYTSHALDPRTQLEHEKEPLVVQVVSLDWKWLFIYPEQGVATINEVYVPVDTPVEFLITSEGSINSFWIPRLGGQIYAMAGMENELHLIANQEGVYRGVSNNYSGFGFSGMRFKAHSVSDEGFNQWVNTVKASPLRLDAVSYEGLVERSRDNPVQYFGSIDALQFKNIIEKFKGVQ